MTMLPDSSKDPVAKVVSVGAVLPAVLTGETVDHTKGD